MSTIKLTLESIKITGEILYTLLWANDLYLEQHL